MKQSNCVCEDHVFSSQMMLIKLNVILVSPLGERHLCNHLVVAAAVRLLLTEAAEHISFFLSFEVLTPSSTLLRHDES